VPFFLEINTCVLHFPCGFSSHKSPQVVIGTKSGEMQIFDLSSSTLVETIKAHTATLWSIHVRPDQQALVTGGADKDVKFWNIEWQQLDIEPVCLPSSTSFLLTVHDLRIRGGKPYLLSILAPSKWPTTSCPFAIVPMESCSQSHFLTPLSKCSTRTRSNFFFLSTDTRYATAVFDDATLS
jgi:WD40 repeat protein